MAIIIVMLSAGLYFFYTQSERAKNDEPTIDEIVEYSLELPEITTNLADDHYIRISFTIQTDGKETKEELEKRSFQVNNEIIKQLSGMKEEDIQGTKGKTELENILREKINGYLDSGEVTKVYITSIIYQ